VPVVDVDLVVLSRELSPLREDVGRSLEGQRGVRVRVHRVAGPRRPDDPNRWATIARARNEGKRRGSAPWFMFVDDDVVLGPRCVARLVAGLRERPGYAALAADYAGDMAGGRGDWDYPPHVGLGATLFRRDRLEPLTFRWEAGKCECRCCGDDLRRAGLGIGYLQGAEAWHRPAPRRPGPHPEPEPAAPAGPAPGGGPALPGRILVAFNRRHARPFRLRFLRSLRASGNAEPVTAIAYGLYPSERRHLARLPGVEVVPAPDGGHPAARRLEDFHRVVTRWPEGTPVAYWDAGDVRFQARLGPLWDLVRAHPDRLLTTRERPPFAPAPGVRGWVDSIRDDALRHRALALLDGRPVLNGGFAAGTAAVLARYLREAERLRRLIVRHGSTDTMDQTALNLYCRSRPDAWREVPTGWNFCLVGLGPADFRVRPDGAVQRLDGQPLHVVHGNDGRLRPWDYIL
jgi:hypothetical protein